MPALAAIGLGAGGLLLVVWALERAGQARGWPAFFLRGPRLWTATVPGASLRSVRASASAEGGLLLQPLPGAAWGAYEPLRPAVLGAPGMAHAVLEERALDDGSLELVVTARANAAPLLLAGLLALPGFPFSLALVGPLYGLLVRAQRRRLEGLLRGLARDSASPRPDVSCPPSRPDAAFG